jgi:signal transduction histidine kinase
MSVAFSKMVFNPVKEISTRIKEIEFQNFNVRLQQRAANDEIADLERTFNGMLDRLETVLATQQSFISNASHELNTPLTAIIGQFDGHAQKMERIRADQLVWDVKSTIDTIYPKNKVRLNLSELPENSQDLKIFGNERLLHTSLSNIVSNACKYSSNETVIITIRSTGRKVWIIVKDYGIGIPPDEQKFIFDPFFRASNAKNFDGYGLGLALTRNIIRLHKGDLRISSSTDSGTIYLYRDEIGEDNTLSKGSHYEPPSNPE